MFNAKPRQGLTLATLLAALLLGSAPAMQPAYADDDVAIGVSDDDAEHVYVQENEEDDDDVVVSNPSDVDCGTTIENSRC